MLASRDPAEVSIQEITEAADVGFSSFYNHFDSKAELFDAALAEAMEELGQLLDGLTRDIGDPAQVFATAVRITARLPKTYPDVMA
jgi:AcrR family transcriptional regulator